MWSRVTYLYGSNTNVYFEPMNEPHGYSSAEWRDIAFFYSAMTYDAFRSHIQTRLGNCASRAVATEYGAPMATGLNYANASSTDNFVRHIRAITQVMRDNQMGGTYWPALGGKPTGSSGYDHYSMFSLGGSGTNLDLTVRNTSGRDRVRYGWGL